MIPGFSDKVQQAQRSILSTDDSARVKNFPIALFRYVEI